MHLTITTPEGGVYPLDVSEELPVGDLKALLEAEVGIPVKDMMVVYNMAPLTQDKETLKSCGIQNEDIIVVFKSQASTRTRSAHTPVPVTQPGTQTQSSSQTFNTALGIGLPNIDWSSVQLPTSNSQSGATMSSDPLLSQPSGERSVESVIQHFLSNPEELTALRQRNPELAEAFMSGDTEWIRRSLIYHRQQIAEEEKERQQLQNLDPWSEEYQQRLAENIRQRNIRDNLETAIEHNPEVFLGRVHMLYISCRVNGILVKALVDTGAQMTVMNVKCAQRCNVMRLVDRRYASYAFGVGRQRIIGIIHLGQIQIGDDFLASSFRVLEDQSHELILGLDMLKRHQCSVDLSQDVLRVGTTGKETPFLSEQEVPTSAYEQEQKGILEDEDHEMASAIATSEKEYQQKTGEPPPKSPRPNPPSSTSFPESSIQRVILAGFTREQAIQELQHFNGDVDKAIAALFAESMKF